MAGDIEAGKAHIKTYVDNSDLVKGLRAAESGLKDFGGKMAAIGSKLTGVGDIIGLTVGKDFAATMLKTVAGATLGAAIAAPLGLAFSKIFKSGQANGLIIELVKLGDSLSVIFDDLATALVPPLTAAARVVTGIVSGAAAWLGNNRQLVVTIAKIAGTVASVGAALVVTGTVVSAIGAGFGVVATVVSAIAGFLATPLGIVVAIGAAIGVGVAAWMRFTDSGKQAAQMLMNFFAPAIAFVKTLIGGIGDALLAGDLELAGQIAVKGLQVVFMTGVNALTATLGGTLGDFFGSVATDLIKGDFKGAWETTLLGLAAAWDALAAGLLAVFSDVIGKIKRLWDDLTNVAVGTLSAFEAIAQIKGFTGVAQQLAKARNLALGAAPVVSGALTVGQSATAVLADKLKGKAADSGTKFRNNIAGGAEEGEAELVKLKAELMALRKRAAKEAAAVKRPELPGKEEFGQVAVGFSGAALAAQLQGGGTSPQKQLVDLGKKQKDLLARAADALDAIKEKFKPFAFGA